MSFEYLTSGYSHIRLDFRPYFTVLFFTGMRTGEINGLILDNVDFGDRVIHIHQTFVRGGIGLTKTSDSHRSIVMSQKVYDALHEPWEQGYAWLQFNALRYLLSEKAGRQKISLGAQF